MRPKTPGSIDYTDPPVLFSGRQSRTLANNVDLAAIASLFHLARATIPERNSSLDWAYGDPRELLAVSQLLHERLGLYCRNRQGNLYNARLDDVACRDGELPYPQGFPNYFSSLDAGLQLLGSYGIAGDITVPSVNEYGAEVLVSWPARPFPRKKRVGLTFQVYMSGEFSSAGEPVGRRASGSLLQPGAVASAVRPSYRPKHHRVHSEHKRDVHGLDEGA
jgi:hypothetical protein